jgi:predicted nucleotide-binding protein (sugar kinase/HSP70/actin superfamily)
VPSFVKNAMDYTSCPIVAGAPNVLKAAFTKESTSSPSAGIKYLDPACSLIEPTFCASSSFLLRELLEITEDESDFACDEAFEALRLSTSRWRRGARSSIRSSGGPDRDPLARPPVPPRPRPEPQRARGVPGARLPGAVDPVDPQGRGVPGRFFAEDLKQGRIKTPLEISDVWPENYSSNSAMKVWAAKFAATTRTWWSWICRRSSAGTTPHLRHHRQHHLDGGTPYSALHDIDANKPGGSIKIRVKTYAHSLRYERDSSEAAANAKALAANATLADMGLVRLGVRRSDTDTISRI